MNHGANNLKDEWKKYKDSKFMKLLLKDIGADHYSIYKNGKTYFLITENNKYAGYIDGDIKNNKFYIAKSSSNIKNGFYQMMFFGLFVGLKVDEILSDTNLSDNAIKSYEKLNNVGESSPYTIKVVTENGYEPFNRELLLKHPNYKISVRDRRGNLVEKHNTFVHRVYQMDEETGVPRAFNVLYARHDTSCNNFLFGESFED